MYEVQCALDDLKNNIVHVPADLLFNAAPDYTRPSAITSGGWRIYANNNKFMRFSAIKTFTFGGSEITYFVHLVRGAKGIIIADAGAEPAIIGSDGLVMFISRPDADKPHILYSTEYCDIEIFLIEGQ